MQAIYLSICICCSCSSLLLEQDNLILWGSAGGDVLRPSFSVGPLNSGYKLCEQLHFYDLTWFRNYLGWVTAYEKFFASILHYFILKQKQFPHLDWIFKFLSGITIINDLFVVLNVCTIYLRYHNFICIGHHLLIS